MDTIYVLVLIAVGVFLGVYGTIVIYHSKTIGSLRVDLSDPDSGPYLFLEMKNDVKDIETREYVTLKVRIREDLSQK